MLDGTAKGELKTSGYFFELVLFIFSQRQGRPLKNGLSSAGWFVWPPVCSAGAIIGAIPGMGKTAKSGRGWGYWRGLHQ